MKWQILLLILFIIPVVYGSQIILTSNQTDYYFPLGTEALISIDVNSTFNSIIQGTITTTYTQKVMQQNMQYQSTNSQSANHQITPGTSNFGISLGSSSSPATIDLDIDFSYESTTEQLHGIHIHFIQDPNQQQKSNEQKKSQTKKPQQQEPQKEQSQIASQPQNQKMDAVQNNQMSQDSTAVKQQLEDQMQKQNQQQEQLKQSLQQDPNFMQKEQSLKEQGYTEKGTNIDAKNSSQGHFEKTYDKNGETASIEGEIKDNKVEKLQEKSNERKNYLLSILKNDSRYVNFNDQLILDGFTEQNNSITYNYNETSITVSFNDKKNKTATITGDFINDNISQVTLSGYNKGRWYIYLLILMIIIGVVLIYFLRNKPQSVEEIQKPAPIKINPKKNALTMLKKAEDLYKKRNFKEAYGLVAMAIRYYKVFTLNLNKELTNTEFLNELKKRNIDTKEIKKALDISALVEFAKYKANDKDFNTIMKIARNIIE